MIFRCTLKSSLVVLIYSQIKVFKECNNFYSKIKHMKLWYEECIFRRKKYISIFHKDDLIT